MNLSLLEFPLLHLKNSTIIRTEIHIITIQLIENQSSIPVDAVDNISELQDVSTASFIWWNIFDSLYVSKLINLDTVN